MADEQETPRPAARGKGKDKEKLDVFKKYKQFIAGFAASMGGFNSGTVLGWPSPGIPLIEKMRKKNDKTFDSEVSSWVAGIINLGAAFGLVIVALIINRLGRKYTMIMTVPLFVGGWLVLGLVDNDVAFLISRFVLGSAAGVFCVACPLYAGEIAEVEVRGIMGVCFQLFLVHGILFSYLLALTHDYMAVCLLNLIPVFIFCIWMLFMPDSPYFFIHQNADPLAVSALEWLRPKDADVGPEFAKMKTEVSEGERRKGTVKDIFTNYANRRSMGVAMLLMFSQQLSGINCVIFNAESIFTDASSGKGMLDPILQAIIIGIVQVVATYIAAIVVERAGRRILMLTSMAIMAVMLGVIGLYFYLKKVNGESSVENIAWLPVASLCIYISAFSIGAGPIPWAMMGEIFPDEIKGQAACVAGIVNWLLSFVVTKTYVNLKDSITVAGTFWLYAGLSVIFFILIFFFMVETRKRTFQEIHGIMDGTNNDMAPIGLKKKR